MKRKDEILQYIKENRPNDVTVLSPMVEDVVFLEERLEELKKLPFIETHPTNEMKQRVTPSGKLYKELLQQYNNCIKVILLKSAGDDSEEESPLRAYMKMKVNK